ncbi:MAG: hypothetical protein MJ014_07665, partial [Methanocorpusculum sp.]|nr:hypothetical protein [Methanocorpusculum sp.]
LEVTVNLSTATVSANIDTDMVTPERIDAAVRGAGFSVNPVPVSFVVRPADDADVSAAARVALQGLSGVLDVSQSGDVVTVSYHPLLADPSQFVPVLKRAGFSSVTVNSGFDDLFYIPEQEMDELSGLRNRTILGFAGSAVLMGLMMFGHPLFAGNMFLMDVLMLVIATLILVVCVSDFPAGNPAASRRYARDGGYVYAGHCDVVSCGAWCGFGIVAVPGFSAV